MPPVNEDGGVTLAGSCPMGCGATLHVRWRGIVECRNPECPRPDAVAVLLADVETEHLVLVGDPMFSYTIQHPLKERLEGQLFQCPTAAEVSDTVHQHMEEPGVYRVIRGGDRQLHWELIGDAHV